MGKKMGKKTEAELAEPQAVVRDDRPRYADVKVPELGGALRIRRMEPEGLFAQIKHLERAGIDPKQVNVSPDTKPELCRLIQRCLVPAEGRGLLCPGGKGLKRLLTLADNRIEALATGIIAFLEI